MDAAYEWQCAQVGVPPHPRLLRNFAEHAARAAASAGPEPLRLGGAEQRSSRGHAAGEDPPVRDADVVAVCLVVRSFAKTAAPTPPVRLDFTGQLITCEGARTVAAVLQVNCGLRTIGLRRTCVSDEGAAALGAALGGSLLTELDLGMCAVGDAGLRLFARGVQLHGAPPTLTALLLDGNPFGDEGAVELISLAEGPRRPPALAILSARPSAPRALSDEVAAALAFVCSRHGIELRGDGQGVASADLPRGARQQGPPTEGGGSPQHGGAGAPAPLGSLSAAWPTSPPSGAVPPLPPAPDLPSGRSSGHLAAWMAGTERELRELRWLLGASSARLDGQHERLMSELRQLRGQLDAGAPPSGDEPRVDALEERCGRLEQLVGREQSECRQMRQLVEVAAGTRGSRTGPSRGVVEQPGPVGP